MPRISLGTSLSRTSADEWEPHTMQAWCVDICQHCWHDTSLENPRLKRSKVSHTPYQRQYPPPHCWLCQAPLDAHDNA
jgi:hypothetical protein